mmetsp:Transcript_14803/g.16510  ORF Transcript_14803/g.16510 Transcript_14803/m.16510 type:complete len:117 (-) Transcript_14803:49-399(-)
MMTRGVKQIRITCFILKKKYLQSLISHTRNLEILTLENCKIQTLDVKFIDTNYKLEQIELENSGKEEYSDWVNNPEGFISFITAIEKCSLKDSLNSISLKESSFIDQDIIYRCIDV